jgi:dTDP-4-amino-4,6-dideoxygalactose transaminase
MNDHEAAIPLFEIDWEDSDIEAATNSIMRGSCWANGPYVETFEAELETFFGVDHAFVVNSGTTALVAALEGLGVGEGDEVIVPSFTFIATANAVRLTGAEPVFADIESDTYGLAPSSVESQITDSTTAIVPVHCYGAPCQIDRLTEIADKHKVALLEDAAEAFGATYDGKLLGTFGDAAALSFCQNKIISTGEGGAVITDDEAIAREVKLYRSHGRASAEYFESADAGQYTRLGTNIRMSDLTAALGCSQLERVDELVAGRRRAARQYNAAFSEFDGIKPHEPPSDGTHVYQLYTVEISPRIDRDRVINILAERNIASKVYWDPPVHRTTYYRETGNVHSSLPTTEKIAGHVLSLPIHPNLSKDEVDRIVAAVETAVTGGQSNQ